MYICEVIYYQRSEKNREMKRSQKNKKYSRRDFIEKTAKAGAGVVLYPFMSSGHAKEASAFLDKSRVVVVKEESAVGSDLQTINSDAVLVMVDAGIRSLTGVDDVGEAWKSLFPGLSQSKRISIKVNCINRFCSSHPEVAGAIVQGLTRMQVEGSAFPEDHIIIWDRSNWELRNAGYVINESGAGVKCYGTDGRYTGDYDVAEKYQKLSQILTEDCDYMINLSVLKNHGDAGVTLGMKNHYGTCSSPGSLHGGYCDPYIPALNALTPIKEKQVINICDALFGVVSGGPGGFPQADPRSMIFSTDPVAHDRVGTQMLKDNGTSDYSIYRASHVQTASTAPYNLGNYDQNLIEKVTIENPTTGIKEPSTESDNPDRFVLFQNYPNPFNGQTRLSYRLATPAQVRLDVYNVRGSFIARLVDKTQPIGEHRIEWAGKNHAGLPVPAGTYLGRLWVNDMHHTIRMQLVK